MALRREIKTYIKILYYNRLLEKVILLKAQEVHKYVNISLLHWSLYGINSVHTFATLMKL